jgi:hypothetical protein
MDHERRESTVVEKKPQKPLVLRDQSDSGGVYTSEMHLSDSPPPSPRARTFLGICWLLPIHLNI